MILRDLTTRICLLCVVLSAAVLLATPAAAGTKPLVVATTTDLADFARSVGGDKVEVFCLLKAGEDPHFVRPTPGAQRKVSEARLFIQTGLDLEVWAPKLLEGARNPNLMVLTATKGIKVREKPTGGVSPGEGHVHPSGNPHVFTNPTNAKIAVSNILGGLIAILPQHEEYFKQRARSYILALNEKLGQWKQVLHPYQGTKLVSYHKSWAYFAEKFGLNFIGEIEPLPGIPPSPRHLAQLIQRMKAAGVKAIVTQPFYPRQSADAVARQTGVEVVVLAGYPGALRGTETYIKMMDHNITTLSRILQ